MRFNVKSYRKSNRNRLKSIRFGRKAFQMTTARRPCGRPGPCPVQTFTITGTRTSVLVNATPHNSTGEIPLPGTSIPFSIPNRTGQNRHFPRLRTPGFTRGRACQHESPPTKENTEGKVVVIFHLQTVFEGVQFNTPEKGIKKAKEFNISVPIGHNAR